MQVENFSSWNTNVLAFAVLFDLVSVRTSLDPVGFEGQVGRDGLASRDINLMNCDRAERRGIGQGAMVNIEFPKRACHSDGLAVGQKLEAAVMLVELNLSRGGDDIVPPEVDRWRREDAGWGNHRAAAG